MKRQRSIRSCLTGTDGSVLGAVMLIMLLVSVLGVGLLRLGEADAIDTSKAVSGAQAFWNAEAGLADARAVAHLNRVVYNRVEVFPIAEPRNWSDSTSKGTYEVDIVAGTATNPSFLITSEGISHGGAQRTVQTLISQVAAISVGVFGSDDLQLQPDQEIYSYYSSDGNPNPTPSDSSGQASIGSNEDVQIQPGTTLDGTVLLGADEDGHDASCSGCSSFDTDQLGHIDPDPLGINEGFLADEFANAMVINDNASVASIAGTVLNVGNGDTVTLPSGDYYLTDVQLRGDLIIPAGGVVNLYVAGEIRSWPNHDINVDGLPTDFRIYSNSTEPIRLQPQTDFHGFIYAPNSDEVRVQPGGDFHGAIWANDIRIQPGGDIFVDMDLLEYDSFDTYQVNYGAWRQP